MGKYSIYGNKEVSQKKVEDSSKKSVDRRTSLSETAENQAKNIDNAKVSHELTIPKNRDWSAARDAILIGPCPHSWLFEQVGAVVHHGGAGN